MARAELQWQQPFTQTLDESAAPNYRWFTDGKLNVSWNCLDVHLAQRRDHLALVFEAEDGSVRRLTYGQLHAEVCRFANGLLALGAKPGDCVVIYMPLVPEVIIAMHACARIGAVHSVVFGGFSAISLRDRIEDAGARFVVTADGGNRGGKLIELKAATDHALEQGCQTIENVVVLRHAGQALAMKAGRDLWWHDVVAGKADQLRAGVGGCRTSAVPALHLRFHRQAQGNPARQRRLPAGREADIEVGVRPQARRHLLVHGRCGLGHGPHLCGLWTHRQWRHRRALRRRADLSGCGALLEDHPAAQGQHLLHRAHGAAHLHEAGRPVPRQLRPDFIALAGQRRRAHQSRSLDLVSRDHRRRALPHCRYLVADRDRRHRHVAGARRHGHQAGFVHVPAARHGCGYRR